MRLHMLKVQSSTLPHFRCQLPGKFPGHMFLTIWVQIQRIVTTFLCFITFYFLLVWITELRTILYSQLHFDYWGLKPRSAKWNISSGGWGGPNTKLSHETSVSCSQIPVLQLGHTPESSQLVTGVQPLTAWLDLFFILPHERDQASSNL